MERRQNIVLGSIACAIIIVSLSVAFWYRGRQEALLASAAAGQAQTGGQSSVPPPLATDTPVTVAVDADHQLYTNSQYHFSLVYPNDLQVEEDKEQGSALTVTFQDPSSNEGFEVYITPYSGTQVTQQRFELDEPSGQFNDPQNVVIDGVQATIFFGNNTIMGDTREVWFIHGGYLYEVATFKQLDGWLSQIMATWKFT